MHSRIVVRRNRGNAFKGVVERTCKLTPGGDPAVHVHDKVAETHLLQPFRHSFDGRSFLGYEEDSLPSGNERP